MAEEQARVVVCPQCGKKYKLKAEFDAASFQCKECAATVPVKKEAKIEPKKGGRAAPKTRAPAAGRSARGRQTRGEEAREGRGEQGGGRPGRHAAAARKPGSQNALIALGGLGLIIAIVLFLVLKGGKEEEPRKTAKGPAPAEAPPAQPAQPETPAAPPPTPGAGSVPTETPPSPGSPGGTPNPAPGAGAPAEAQPAAPGGTTPPAEEPGKKLTGGGEKKGRWDPPADLGFPPEATAEDQKEIDRLISVVCDPMAGRDGLDAKERLVTYDKKAFPRILGTMAKIRDTIGDVDSMEERQSEASLYLLDKVLREMDGFLDSRNAQPIRPGTDKKYITSILQRHYKRWVETLSKMDKMPGVYDASGEYEKEEGGEKPPQ